MSLNVTPLKKNCNKYLLILHLYIFYRWLIRCSPDYSIKLNVTDFQIEKNSDEILLYDATLSGSNLVGEITSLGEIETSTSELMVSFKSDCEVTNKGFQAFVKFVEKSSDSNKNLKTISEPEITEYLETTTAITTMNYPTTTTTLGQNTDYMGTELYGKLLLIKTINLNKVIRALMIEYQLQKKKYCKSRILIYISF